MKHKQKILSFFLPALFVMALGIYFRLYPLIHRGEPDANKLASLIVYTHLKQQVQDYIASQNTTLSDIDKTRLAQENLTKLIKENQNKVQAMVQEGVRNILNISVKITEPTLLEADSYYFLGLTENINETGSISKQIKDGKYFNPLMLAPNGKWEPLNLHPYVGFYIYKIISFFNKNASLISSVLYTVIILSAICVIPFVLICFEIGISPLAAFVGSIFLLLAPFFTQRTAYGWFDNDVYSILFPLLILLFIFAGINPNNKFRINILYALMAAFFTGLYQLFWLGWGFMPGIILASLPVMLVINKVMLRSWQFKKTVVYSTAYLGATCFWVSILISPLTLIHIIQQGWLMLSSYMASKFDLWPNIFITVGETQPMNMYKTSILVCGNPYLIYIALAGPLLYLVRSIRHKNIKYIYFAVILVVFTAITLYLSLKAARFAILLTVPIALALSLSIDFFYRLLKEYMPRLLRLKKPIVKTISIIAALVILSTTYIPITAAYQIVKRIYPIYNKTWEKVLLQLKNETPKNSIVNTWWCPGHFITAVAKRSVSADGASQEDPATYWMANIFLAQDEQTAIGLLRMLNLSGNKALDYLHSHCGRLFSDSTDILKKIAPLNRNDALQVLKSHNLSDVDAQNLLHLTHDGTPPPSYLLNYNELIDMYLTFPFIANWDFKKAEFLLSGANGLKIKIPSRTSAGYIDFVWSISGGLPPCSPQYPEIYRNNNFIMFENKFVVELKTFDCFMLSPDGKKFAKPQSLFYIENGDFKEKKFDNAAIPFSVLLIEKNNAYQCIMLDRALAKSLLFRLYYLNGKGLSFFKPYIREEDPLTNTIIMVYKIDWGRR